MRTALFSILIVPVLFLLSLLLLPKNTFAAWVLNPPTGSGGNITFSFNPGANDNFSVNIRDANTNAPVKDSGKIPTSSGTTWTWNGAPDGSYKAVLIFATSEISNTVAFTVTGGAVTAAGPAPVGAASIGCVPGSAKTDPEAIDQENKCRIQYNIYDDKATTFNIVAGLGDGFYKLLTGHSRLYPQTDNVTAGMGALASSGTMVATLYTHPPVSGMDYLAGEFNKFNPVTPAYAAGGGIGFNALAPVQTIWESFRNIAYIGFVLVFVIIGFMIMFRAHISPQAVATVQDSLPRIVIALFLVTFSYAIAGFMIDAMFLFLNVIINALPGGAADKQYVFHKSVFGAIWGSWTEVFGTVSGALTKIIGQITDLGVILNQIIKYFGGVVGALVVGIALLFVMFKVFIMLLISYAYIIILTITAPFFFLAQALPGNNSGPTWFKQMASNIAVFPVVAIMFIFAGILGGISSLGGSAATAVQSGTVGQFPLLSGDIDANAIGKLIAVGILLMTPGAAELVKNAIGAKGPNAGAGIGAGLAGGAAVVGAAGRGAFGAATTRGPIGGWRRASEAKRQEEAQTRAGLRTFTNTYKETAQDQETKNRPK